MLRTAAINMYKRTHRPSINETRTRGVDLGKVLCVLMKSVVKVQYIDMLEVALSAKHNTKNNL